MHVATAGAQTPARVAEAQNATNSSRRTALVAAADRVAPAVVSINVTARQQAQRRSPFDLFFVPEGARVVQGSGTGFLVRPNGIIVTNQHVVSNAERVVVTLPDGSDLPATVMGEDPLTDIAVLKVERENLPTVALGRSTDLMIGEWVVALGNPYAYLLGNSEPSVSVGVVSATGRNILPGGDQTGLYLDMIQTDAAINPGNSGGPLTNALGEVVGVNSSIFSSSGGSVGLGFAIPIERAVRVADEIIKRGSVRRAWVGLEVQGARAMREWKSQGGVVLSSVAPDGPAARAGLSRGDVLVEANGRRLRNYLDWEAVKLDLHVGDAVQVGVRSGERDRLPADRHRGPSDGDGREDHRAAGPPADQCDAGHSGGALHPERPGRPDLPPLSPGQPGNRTSAGRRDSRHRPHPGAQRRRSRRACSTFVRDRSSGSTSSVRARSLSPI